MRHSAKGLYEFMGKMECPGCEKTLVPATTDYRRLRCGSKLGTHAFQWNYDAQDWSSVGVVK